MAKITIDNKRVSKKAWGDVDKAALGKSLAGAYAAGEISKAGLREAYAFVPEDAFGKDAKGNPSFAYSKAWGPHHELDGSTLILNAAGVAGAAGAAAGARSAPSLSAQELTTVKAHLRKHYKAMKMDAPAGISESLRRVEKGRALEELVKGSLDYTMAAIREAFRTCFNPVPSGWII